MAGKTKIEWTEYSWNPIRGCSRITEGCRNCYAEDQAARIIKMDRGRGVPEGEGSYDGLLAKGGQWNGEIKVVPELLDQPVRWTKPRMIFVNSMSDLFHENVPAGIIQRIFAVMAAAPQHTFQILTKRAGRMREILSTKDARWVAQGQALLTQEGVLKPGSYHVTWPLPNVWLGVSVENQDAADERIPQLLETPAAVRWLSMEPLRGPVNLTKAGVVEWDSVGDPTPGTGASFARGLVDWVVLGGESGPDARPMHPEWVKELRDQCVSAEIPFLFKQWGEWVPRSACFHTFEDGKSCGDLDPECKRWPCIRLTYKGQDGRCLESDTDGGSEAYMQRVGKAFAGRRLNGKLHDGYPG